MNKLTTLVNKDTLNYVQIIEQSDVKPEYKFKVTMTFNNKIHLYRYYDNRREAEDFIIKNFSICKGVVFI
jgi:hypothetical protein